MPGKQRDRALEVGRILALQLFFPIGRIACCGRFDAGAQAGSNA
ncbi:hypothetical protein [Ktedonosporobacter rubrisoli]|nr:hypothetical protein [Ktedonosporobacter rubrisoli]